MRWIATVTTAVLIGLVPGLPAPGQTALERLEDMLRQEAPGEAAGARVDRGAGAAERPPSDREDRQPGYLGVMADEDQPGRVRILKVFPGSPAEQAGIQPEDLLTRIGTVPVGTMAQLADVLTRTAPGGTLRLGVLRGQREMDIAVTLGRPPGPPPEADRPDDPPPQPGEPIRLEDLLERIEALERRVEQLEQALSERG